MAHRDGHPSADRLGVLAVRGQGGQPRPHSFFTVASAEPPVICFTSVGSRDSLRNIQQTGEFVVCLTPRAWAEPVNLTGTNLPAQAREFDTAGLTREPRVAVTPIRVAESPVALQCRLHHGRRRPGTEPGHRGDRVRPGQVAGTVHAADGVALRAKNDLVAAYDDAAGRPTTATVPVELGASTKTLWVYGSPAGTFGITGTLTLDAEGDLNAVFIFTAASTLVTASASSVDLVNGARSSNIFWVVGSSATLGTYSILRGNILALASITVTTGVTVDGRTLARTAAVTWSLTRSPAPPPVPHRPPAPPPP